MRILVISDTHGAAKAIEQCFKRSGFDPVKDKLIHLGDVADGWNETSESVDLLIDVYNVSAGTKTEPIFIRGNHDCWVYDWFNFGTEHHLWTEQGGRATINSYIKSGIITDNMLDMMGKDSVKVHKWFWDNQKDWYIDDQNRLFIHAGWEYVWNKEKFKQKNYTPLEMFEIQAGDYYGGVTGTVSRGCHWDRSLYYAARSAFYRDRDGSKGSKFTPLDTFKEIFIGHTSHSENGPQRLGNLYNLDSGAGYRGVATIMDINTKEYWCSDKTMDLYPNERGRN